MTDSLLFNTFNTQEALHQALIKRIVNALESGIQTNGVATLAVSGGSTPKKLFAKLSHTLFAWEKVTITLVDERWVDEKTNDSNAYLVNQYLLKNHASKASFVGLKTDDVTAAAGTKTCTQQLQNLSGPFDVVILGMGDDGHTASFFPNADALDEALTSQKSCIALHPLTAPYERMTLTRSRLLNTKTLLLHIEGENKEHVFRQALLDGPVEAMPIRTFIRQTVIALEVYFTKERP